MKSYAKVIEWSDEDGKYVVCVPDLPGCVTAGETREEAARMGEEAMASYLASAAKHGGPVPAKRFTTAEAVAT